MLKEMSESFARRARLSSKAIVTAVALTLAALIAFLIAARDPGSQSVEIFSPVTSSSPVKAESASGLVPVVNR